MHYCLRSVSDHRTLRMLILHVGAWPPQRTLRMHGEGTCQMTV
ncbi:hypothetical protein IB238_05730 [Rhizobium sp. ARZ01]|nr:hypothetical protein [Rhizobium sp. ARZ01]